MSWCRAPLWSLGRPLWRDYGSVICSAICQWSESRRTHNHTLLSHLRLLGSLSVALKTRRDYGGSILTLLHTGSDCVSESEPESLYGWQSVSQCLGIEPTLWTFDQILLPFQVAIFWSSIHSCVSAATYWRIKQWTSDGPEVDMHHVQSIKPVASAS
jgi:hypothetical protein